MKIRKPTQVKISKTVYDIERTRIYKDGSVAWYLRKKNTEKVLFCLDKEYTLWSGRSNRGIGLPRTEKPVSSKLIKFIN